MLQPAQSRFRYRFGPFQLDLDACELLESGKPLHTPAQTLHLLELFLSRADRLVTRQQVREALWPEGTFVNFERGINSAVRRLRALLHDSDENPIYIATVTGQGYRFIAPVERLPVLEPQPATPPPALPQPPPASTSKIAGGTWTLAAVGVLLVWALAGWAWPRVRPMPRVLRIRPLTTDGGLDLPARPASDGALIYFLDRAGGRWDMTRSDGYPASAQRLPSPVPGRNVRLLDISHDRSQWLLASFTERGQEADLWRQPASGGAPIRLGDLRALDAVWSPDDTAVYYSFHHALWRALPDGSHPQRLIALADDPDWLVWSPDGDRLRFNADNPATHLQAVWEWQLGSGAAHPLPASLPQCCGAWTRSGRYFIYSVEEDGVWNLWAQATSSWPRVLWPWLQPDPAQITFQPRSSWGAFTGFGDPRTLTFYQQQWHEDAARYQPASHQLNPLLSGHDAIQVVYSHDGRHLAYLDTRDSTVWTADLDSHLQPTNFRQLSSPPLIAAFPRWSPDGQWIVFSGQAAAASLQIYKVSAAGGPVVAVTAAHLPAGADLTSPDWSPDGDRLALTVSLPGNRGAIGILSQGALTLLPDSALYNAAHWSPDGGWLAAQSNDQHAIALYDFHAARWQVVATGNAFTEPLWSPNGDVYFQDLLAPGEPLFRFRPGASAPEKVSDFTAILAGGVHRCGFAGFAPDGSLLLSLNRSSADLYAATLDLP